jgi:hypothetical protein
MSDFMEMTENYKKIWEQNLAKQTQELERLKSENVRFRDALEKIGMFSGPETSGQWAHEIARDALKGGE